MGSFTLAARQLGLTPSAVSKLVQRLEHRLGVRLMHRTTRRVSLTEAGRIYCERARRVLAEMEGLEQDLRGGNTVPRGLLKLTAPPNFGELKVMPVVVQLLHAWPDLRIEASFTDEVLDLVAEGIDVAVRFAAKPTPASWVAKKLMDQRRKLCASPSYLARRGVPRSIEDLALHDHVMGPRHFGGSNLVLRTWLGRAEKVQISGRLEVSHSRNVLAAALAGLGLAELDEYCIEDHLREGRLVSVLDGRLPVERTVWVMHAPGPNVPAKVRAFVEAMIASVRPAKTERRRRR
jgi:DNA-binding transcriptional LysR family regulator